MAGLSISTTAGAAGIHIRPLKLLPASLKRWRDRALWYTYRLGAMGPREIGERLAERWKHRDDAGFAARVAAMPFAAAAAAFPVLKDPALAPAPLRRRLAIEAQTLLAGEWQLFGWRAVDVGAPPCWHRDPTCGVVIRPQTLSFHLDHRHLPDGADARAIWEINRWAEITRLAMHGRLNDDAPAIRTAQLWLEDWCDRNPAGFGINWTSPLEAALRLINFTWFDALVHATGKETLIKRQGDLVRRIVPVHAAWIWRYRSFGSSANNHLLGELAGLIVAGRRWPAIAHLACCPERAWQMMGVEIMRQFADDGGSHEQALHYHLFALEMAWQAAAAAGSMGEEVWERLNRAAGYFAALAQGEEPWDFGDSDDAQITPFAVQRSDAVTEWLGWLRGNERGSSIRFWLGAPPRVEAAGHEGEWNVFPTSGIASARHGRWIVRVDASALGYGSMAAHGHLDALHVSLWQNGRAVLIDPGTGAYYGNPVLRRDLAAWEAHNGPVPVTGRTSPRRIGPFLWAGHHAAPQLRITAESCVMSYADNTGFVKRELRFAGDRIVVRDEVCGRQLHQVTWQLSPQWLVFAEHDAPGGASFRLEHVSGLALRMQLQGDQIARAGTATSTVSPHFGQTLLAPTVRVQFRGALTTSWIPA